MEFYLGKTIEVMLYDFTVGLQISTFLIIICHNFAYRRLRVVSSTNAIFVIYLNASVIAIEIKHTFVIVYGVRFFCWPAM